jgi:prolyl oligopeptidase
LVFHNDDDPEPSYAPQITEDERFLVVVEYLGTDRRNGLLALDLEATGSLILDQARPAEPIPPAAWTRLVAQGEALHDVVHHHDGHFLVHTDRDAPQAKLVSMDLAAPDPQHWLDVIPEGADRLEWVAALSGELVAARLVDASHQLHRYALDGAPLGPLDLPGLGSITGLAGRFSDDQSFFGYQSFVEPPTVLTRPEAGEGLTVHAGSEPPIDPAGLVVERHHAVSSDGRSVGLFVIRSAEASLPGPVELYGYGGFSINLTPVYSPARLAFIEAGGIVAVANLRGGTELGEDWHTEGMLGNKQQVFDDLFACAEHLVTAGVATTDSIGIRGGSNGGLLTAATMIQRPELFGAVVSQVPVTDMLRYQHFTAGRFWTVEYGDSADPEAFEWLIEYSPIHNVGDASIYPPLLITTAESDDRVVPMHSHKLAAEIQHRAGGRSDQPLLERVETRAGHGLGKPTSKLIEEAADIYAFLLHHLRP